MKNDIFIDDAGDKTGCQFGSQFADNTTKLSDSRGIGRLVVFEIALFAVKMSLNSLQRMFNYDSTDQWGGFPCWQDAAQAIYMNTDMVKKAINLPTNMMNVTWADCK